MLTCRQKDRLECSIPPLNLHRVSVNHRPPAGIKLLHQILRSTAAQPRPPRRALRCRSMPPGAYTMENTPTFAAAPWVPCTTMAPWTLAPNPGPETVSAEFKSVGGTIVGNAQASITLAPAVATIPVLVSPTSSTASLAVELSALQAELAALRAKQGGNSHIFSRNLGLGMTGSDVKALQLFLITQASGPLRQSSRRMGRPRPSAS